MSIYSTQGSATYLVGPSVVATTRVVPDFIAVDRAAGLFIYRGHRLESKLEEWGNPASPGIKKATFWLTAAIEGCETALPSALQFHAVEDEEGWQSAALAELRLDDRLKEAIGALPAPGTVILIGHTSFENAQLARLRIV
ncbi:MAG: hypothetical protein ACKVVT_03395 [Dehalococcoidia bacterium]